MSHMPTVAAELLGKLGVRGGTDAHVHAWDAHALPGVIQAAIGVRPDLGATFSPEMVTQTAREHGMSGVILVQACDGGNEGIAEARYFLKWSHELGNAVRGAVLGVDLLDTKSVNLLCAQTTETKACGVRMVRPENVQPGDKERFFSNPKFRDTAAELVRRNLTLDLLIRCSNPRQLDELVQAVSWLSEDTELRMVGDHLLKPVNVGSGRPDQAWLNALTAFAACPSFWMKLSGMPGEVPQGTDPVVFYPFFDAALAAFGPDRLLFGSDYPVSHGYGNSVLAVANWIASRDLGAETAQKIFGGNAEAAYALKPCA